MRTTINIDDDLLAKASEYTGIKERSTLLRVALEKLVAVEAEKRLARLKGSMPDVGAPPRRRPPDFRNPE
jgi:Arc/MetJ family transcription regulator